MNEKTTKVSWTLPADPAAPFKPAPIIMHSVGVAFVARPSWLVSRRWRYEGIERCDQFWQVFGNDLPHDVFVHGEIIVDDFVAHADDVGPWNFRGGRKRTLATRCGPPHR